MPGGAEAGCLAPLAEPLLASRDGEMDVLPASNIRSAAGAGVLREQGSRFNSLQLDSQSDIVVEIVGGEEQAAGGASVSSDARGCRSSRWGLLTFDMAAAAARALPIALLNLTHAYSFAQLVCVDTPLEPTLVAAMHLTGLVVMQARLSSSSAVPRYAIATCDITIAMLCRQMVAGIYRHLRFNSPLMGSASQQEAEARATSLFAILLASFSQGALYWATGYVRAAELVLFLPYPVLAGLLAVVGGMATAGAASVASGSAVTDLDSLNSALSESGPQLAAAAGLAGLSLVISSRLHSLSAFVLLMPAGLIIFYAAAGFNGMSLDHLTKRGWLFPAEAGAPLLSYVHPLLSIGGLRHVSFRAIAAGLNDSIAASITTLAALMLKVIALESAAGAYLDSDAEMRVVGSAAMLGSLAGGVAAHPSPECVGVLKQARVTNHKVGLAALLLTCGVLLGGPPLMNVLPRPLLGGLLMAHGFELCKVWAWDARRWIDTRGLAVLLLVLTAAILFGQTAAVFLAALATVAVSTLRTSRANALKYHLTGRSCHSLASRPLHVQAFLRRHGAAIHLVGLEGFLFGGTVSRLARYVFRASERNDRAMRFVILDVQAAHGLEPSAGTLLRRLRRQLGARGITLLVAAASAHMEAGLCCHDRTSRPPPAGKPPAAAAPGAAVADAPAPRAGPMRTCFYRSAEEALEFCEDSLLALGSPEKTRRLACDAERPVGAPHGAGPGQVAGEVAGGVGGAVGGGKRWSSACSLRGCDSCGPADASSHGRDEPGSGSATPLPAHCRPYTLDSRGAPALPFAPSLLPPGLPWEAVAALGSETALRPGELLTAQGKLSREVIVVPPSGAELIISTDFGSSDGPLRLAAMRHGGVFGVEGVLLGLPSVATTVLAHTSGPRVVLTLSAGQLRTARRTQPQLVHQLLAASYAQQQDFLWMLARRTSLWTGGGHAGPRFDSGAAPVGLVTAGGIPSIPSVASMPESFGRMQIESVVAAPWRVAETAGTFSAPRLFGGRFSVGHIFGLAGAWQPPPDQRRALSPDRSRHDPSRMRRFGGSRAELAGRPVQHAPAVGARAADADADALSLHSHVSSIAF